MSSYKPANTLKPITSELSRIECSATIRALGLSSSGVIEVCGRPVKYEGVGGREPKRKLWRCPACDRRVAHLYEPNAICRYCLKLDSPSHRRDWRRLPAETRKLILAARKRKPAPRQK